MQSKQIKIEVMKTKNLILFLIVAIFSFQASAQVVRSNKTSIVPSFEKQKKKKPVELSMKKGQTVELHFFVFENKAYTFTVNASAKLKDVGFRIINDQGDVLFDNALAAYTNSVILYADRTQKVSFKISVQPAKFLESNSKKYNVTIKVSYKQNMST